MSKGKIMMNQMEIDLLAELYEEEKTPEEMVDAINQMAEKPFAESAGDALKKVMKQLQDKGED